MKFKLNIKKGLGILIFVIVANVSFSQQDPMYTQYIFNTQTINPAYAGTWESLGFIALARQQWAGWDGAPQTYTFSMQAPMRNERVALGLNVISDKVGREKRFGLFGDYSYRVQVSEQTDLRMGIKGGFTSYSHNLENYDLYPGVNDPMFQGEFDRKFMPNFGIGLFLSNERYYVGFSVPKLIHNDFDTNINNYSVQAEMRHYFLEGGLVFDLGESVKFKPTFLTKTAWGTPLAADLTANFLLKEKLWLGASVRTNESYGIIAQWIFDNKLRIGYSFDFTTNNLQNYHNGSHEVMISYEMKFLKELVTSPRYF